MGLRIGVDMGDQDRGHRARWGREVLTQARGYAAGRLRSYDLAVASLVREIGEGTVGRRAFRARCRA